MAVFLAFRKCFTNRGMKALTAFALLKAVWISSKLCCLCPFRSRELCEICLLFGWFPPVRYFAVNDFVAFQEGSC